MRISAIDLHLTAALLGLVGTALVIVQAMLWIPDGHANHAVLILVACVPLIAVIFFAVARWSNPVYVEDYPLQSPMVLITLGLPVMLTVFAIVLVGVNDNFDSFAGLALILGLNAGRNLRDFIHCQLRKLKLSP